MPSESHVYDLFDLEGKRIGVCMPSRGERQAGAVLLEGRVFLPERVRHGPQKRQIISYQEVVVAEPKVIIYGR